MNRLAHQFVEKPMARRRRDRAGLRVDWASWVVVRWHRRCMERLGLTAAGDTTISVRDDLADYFIRNELLWMIDTPFTFAGCRG